MSLEQKIAAELASLQDLGLEALREVWRERWGTPPRLRSPDILRRMIAWRIQEAAFGGLDSQARRALRLPSTAKASGARLTSGTILAREWKGRRHEVQVTEDGFLHEGATYRSLSKVASVIAGSKWNGHRFFGLKEAA